MQRLLDSFLKFAVHELNSIFIFAVRNVYGSHVKMAVLLLEQNWHIIVFYCYSCDIQHEFLVQMEENSSLFIEKGKCNPS